MTKMLFTALACALLAGCATYGARNEPMVIGDRIHVAPGARVEISNVDFRRDFPRIDIGAGSTVVITGAD